MSELQNPLFDEEKEFLERKKLEYERALRGDVDHLKEQSVKVGKVALVGTGLAGGLWLITKAIKGLSGSGKKSKKSKRYAQTGDDRADYEPDGFDNGFEDEYFTAGNGKRYKSVIHHKSAADSARVFMEKGQEGDHQQEQGHESDDLGFGSKAASYSAAQSNRYDDSDDSDDEEEDDNREPSPFDTEDFEDDPFQDLPYDDSRRLPTSRSFDEGDGQSDYPARKRSGNSVGSVLQAFLKTDTGKMLVAQAAAVALAMVTKKVSEFFPTDKNPDLATSPGYAPAETGFAPVASLASPDSPDASTHSSSI